ncbi:Serine/threonine-protein kinase PK-1 [Planctomycetes bacterium Poly30]|uniref:Serine/threonine-protein kinase PK-1 n=1 Tax=Saltatorellus ferox TaxID=2528018 RepID=A0A518EQS1_9BACT|nr:Serine/threonine-protein kinase PK-1 [Planctomycetes bacterium Poly30]
MTSTARSLRPRQQFGQYRIQRRLAAGGFATVYAATDTIADRTVALKVLHEEDVSFTAIQSATSGPLADIKREVRMAARLEHPNVLGIRNATVIEGRFVLVTELATESLDDRLGRRLGPRAALDIAGQMLEGLAHAHECKVVHCDVKPDNVLLFPEGNVRIGDFGLARLDKGRLEGSGSGTIGYMAPEQAFGRPSVRSDVFSAGLVIYRMLAGETPEWPFEWPYAGATRIRAAVHRDMIDVLKRAIQVPERKRFASCVTMLAAFQKARRHALRSTQRGA